jgi:3-oxoacyl-[acyl-carrier-protein] synthase II
MKITLVYPRFEKFLWNNPELERGLVDYFLGDFTTPPSLGIPIIASLTPPELDVELVDDNSGDPIDYDVPTDLVGINCFTPQATRAFEIADNYRAHGKKVIMGGFFPSFMVEECLKHCDSVNVGEVEPTWDQILADVRAGQLKRTYVGGSRFDVSKMKIPRRDIFYKKTSYDWDEDLVQTTRGCSYTCGMCAIPAHMGNRIRFRPVEHVVEEIKTLKYENVYLADDTLFFPHKKIIEYSTELFKALVPLKKKYFVASTLALNIDKDFMDLAARAGVANFYCTMNVDPVSIRALQGEKKERQMLVDLVKTLTDRGIRFFGSCAVGRDWDDTSIADRVLELFHEADIHTSEFFVFTPYPGSVHWDRLVGQGRIIDRTWSHYNGAHVVSRPEKMTPDQLYEQFIKIWNEFFRSQKKAHAAALEPSTYQDGVQIVGKPLQRKGVRGQAVVTGIGAVSAIGSDVETIAESLRTGRHGLKPITKFDTSHFRMHLGGQINDFDPLEMLREEEIREYDDLYLQYAISSARKAIAHAGLPWNNAVVRRDVALVLGTCNGGLLSAEREYAWKHGKSPEAFDEKMNLQAQYYGFGKAMARALGIGGEVWLVTTACSSTTGALGLARLLISRGYYSTVIVGGSDTLCMANVAGFDGLKATSSGQTAPFSMPIGLNVGEASVFWVVEEMEKAMLRHAHCLGKIAGHATTCDAYHPTSPDPRGDGVFRTLRNALADSGLDITDIGCVNAHGTGTDANDKAESKGIAKLIGTHPIPAVSTKSFFGHCMGTTGILEATCNLVAMNKGFIPPTVNFSEPRPGCTLDYVPNVARDSDYRAFLSANYAFGGNNAAVAIAAWDRELPPRTVDPERVVITGTGVATALGLGSAATLSALRAGTVGLGGIERLGLSGMRSTLAGLVPPIKSADVDKRIDFQPLNQISACAVAASKLALDDAGLKVMQKNAEDVGIAMGVCNGPNEMGHMDSVFAGNAPQGDVGSFTNIVANSTAGWVANSLTLKGVNTSLASGPHAGLQSLAYAFDVLGERRVKAMLASASDEVYPQTYFNYDLIGFLHQGDNERNYRLCTTDAKRKVLGEGAATLVMETLASATERGARVLAEVQGYGMSMDAGPFSEQNMDPEGLVHAIQLALTRSELSASEIDLIVWAPQGNAQDRKTLEAARRVLGVRTDDVPMVTTVFNTGYIESASILVGVAATLEALKSGTELWPQRTGDAGIDSRRLAGNVRTILVIASTDLGYNYAVTLRSGGEH